MIFLWLLLKNTPLFSTVIPSKIFESMAMKVPVVIAVPEGEATNIVNENSGLIVAHGKLPKAC